MDKQKNLYEIFSEDKLNIDIYKDKADLLRNEEKNLRREIKEIEMQILKNRNSINVVTETHDFLVKLKNTSKEDQCDYAIKTFMRIIFKNIYIQNQEVVKVEINHPWKMCYEEGLKCLNTLETKKKEKKKVKRSRQSYCVPTAGRWTPKGRTLAKIAKALINLDM